MKDIKSKVDKLVRQYKTRNLFEIVKGMNVILVYYPLEGVRGGVPVLQTNNIIYIDDTLPDLEKRFVPAHELGHMILHKKSNAIFMDTRTCLKASGFELEADIFAIHLLISDEDIKECEDCTLEQLSRTLGYRQKLIELWLK